MNMYHPHPRPRHILSTFPNKDTVYGGVTVTEFLCCEREYGDDDDDEEDDDDAKRKRRS